MESRQIIKSGEELVPIDGILVERGVLLEQLERLLESRHFRNSKRYPAFLRFVVEHTLSGNMDVLKERTLGVDVFARPSDYDTNVDPIVRVTAGEVRKRIAQYYQEPGREHELRIDLPLGAYVPHFFFGAVETGTSLGTIPEASTPLLVVGTPLDASEAPMGAAVDAVVVAVKPRRKSWRKVIVYGVLGLVLIALVVAGWRGWRTRRLDAGWNAFWQPIMASRKPVLDVVGVHTLDRLGNDLQPASHAGGAGEPGDMLSAMVRSDMVPMSDLVSNSRLTDLLTRHTHAYTMVGSADATLEQMRAGPVVLIGGLDNIWTLRLTSKLRYHFFASPGSESSIVDREDTGKRWTYNNLQKSVGSTQDYAIVASYFDDTIDQPVIVVAGIGKTGTLVASEFATSEEAIRGWLSQTRVPPGKNFEVVLGTEILDGQAGPPRVVATAVW